MTIQRFEILNKAVQLKSLTKAGSELNLTQSGISHAIRSLENELGLNLLLRNRSGIKLTKEGEKIYQHSLNIMNAYNNLLQEASALRGLDTGEINIGTFASVTTNWLPSILKQFKTQYPNVEINIFEDDYESLERGVESGELDCCFTIDSPKKNIEFIPLKKDKLFCIVSNDNPLSKQSKMKIKQIEEYPLIKPKKGWDHEVNEFFLEHNINVTAKYEISDDQSIIALVKADLGINIRPELVLTNAPAGITAIELEKEAYRIIGLGVTNRPSHATKSFVSIVSDLYNSMES